jgi:hypothetical protein
VNKTKNRPLSRPPRFSASKSFSDTCFHSSPKCEFVVRLKLDRYNRPAMRPVSDAREFFPPRALANASASGWPSESPARLGGTTSRAGPQTDQGWGALSLSLIRRVGRKTASLRNPYLRSGFRLTQKLDSNGTSLGVQGLQPRAPRWMAPSRSPASRPHSCVDRRTRPGVRTSAGMYPICPSAVSTKIKPIGLHTGRTVTSPPCGTMVRKGEKRWGRV